MELKHEMMLASYGIYLSHEKDLEHSTITSYKGKASDYYTSEAVEEKPSHLEEAEEIIGFKN